MLSFGYRLYDSLCNFALIILTHLIMHLKTETYISIIYGVLYVSAEDHDIHFSFKPSLSRISQTHNP